MQLPAKRADRGFTLVEVMVAIFIMMIGMLALLQTVNLAIAYNTGNKMRNDAIMFAEESVASQRTMALSGIIDSAYLRTHKVNLGFVNYSVVNSVTALNSQAKKVTVTVFWREKGVRKSQTLMTTIAETAN
jgi:type IV pilus assembly protein PilV